MLFYDGFIQDEGGQYKSGVYLLTLTTLSFLDKVFQPSLPLFIYKIIQHEYKSN